MAAAGYSGTPLLKKLGIQPGIRLLLMNAPSDYFKLVATDLSEQLSSPRQLPDLIHFFAKDNVAFKAGMKKILLLCTKKTGIIVWVSWYKKSSGVITDLTEDMIRDFALQNDLVDIKVCAVSEEWSGLKLVVPLAKR